MKFKLSLFAYFCSLTLVLLSGCSEDKDSAVACTEEFVSIPLTIKEANGKPVALDSYEVFIKKQNITPVTDFNSYEYLLMQECGEYPIVNDGMRENLLNKRVAAKVIGYIGGKKLFETIVEVSAGECHVYSLSDKNEIILDI